jgi:uncharacterized protein DUF417
LALLRLNPGEGAAKPALQGLAAFRAGHGCAWRWVPPPGSPEHGFPLLSGAGRLVIKDAIMAGAAPVTMAGSAKAYLRDFMKR